MKEQPTNPYGPTKDFPGFYDHPVEYQLRCRALFYQYVFLHYEQKVARSNTDFIEQVRKLWPSKSKKLSLHKLRDSGILYLLYEKDWNEKNVMAITGHSSFSSFEKYIHKNAKAVIQEKKKEYPVKSWLSKKNKWLEGVINE